MLLTRTFSGPELNLTLERFLRVLREELGERLVSVVLYGSIVFDDLAPGYGDLDFLAVVDDDLSEEMLQRLTEARKPLRSGGYGQLAWMLEGAFLPRKMLDPDVTGSALWWGTTREVPWDRSKLGWLVLHVIRERGMVIYGQDIRQEIPAAKQEDLIEDVRAAFQYLPNDNVAADIHSVDFLLTAARLLLWLREGRLSSKSEAADWGVEHAAGEWRKLLPMAKEMRLNPALAESDQAKQWLAVLDAPVREAWRELENTLPADN